MGTFVALLRGIMPGKPNMSNARLAAALEDAGCTDVQPVLASGNLVFHSSARGATALARRIERSLSDKLAVTSDVVVLSETELRAIVKKDPFHGAEHGKEWYLTVTFRKEGGPPLFNQTARADMNGPEFMADLERRHGKHITTRTWNTLLKILAKMGG